MNRIRIGALLLAPLLVTSCQRPPESTPGVPLGAPIAGLTDAERTRMLRGEALFNHVFKPETGLGPLFNGDQCSACHTTPVTGGTGDQFVHRQSRFDPVRGCDVLSAQGGENIRLFATPALRTHDIEKQPEPAAATEKTRFNVPFVFGLGLVDAVPEAAILERADPDDRDGDGISGRPGQDSHGRFARFGRKADQATLRAFVENAAHAEMGLTTPMHPGEGTLAGRPFPAGSDLAAEPELSENDAALITDFVRFLGAPAQRIPEADRADIVRGEELFHTTGCSNCHRPTLTTGEHEVKALDRKTFRIFSDLLLHDMGPDLANVCAAGATPTETRTEPLIGLGHRRTFLHDGRTNDLSEAINFHGGEAAAVRARFNALNEIQKLKLLRFLQSL